MSEKYDYDGAPQLIGLPGGHVVSMQALTVDGRAVSRVSHPTGECGDLPMVEVDLMNHMAAELCDPPRARRGCTQAPRCGRSHTQLQRLTCRTLLSPSRRSRSPHDGLGDIKAYG